MAMGSGSASQVMLLAFIGSILLLHCYVAESTNYTVGGTSGWGFNASNWSNDKTFKARDYLEFKYSPAMHNVVVVNATHFKDCTVPSGAKVYKTGHDKIKLTRGAHFFICGKPGHCDSGMKINATAH